MSMFYLCMATNLIKSCQSLNYLVLYKNHEGNIRGVMSMRTISLRPYAKRRMDMKKRVHWPKYIWDGGNIRRMHLRDYLTFLKILFLHGSDGVKQTKHENR